MNTPLFPESNARARVFLVDDHPAVRQGLCLVLAAQGHRVCGEAETLDNARHAIDAALNNAPPHTPQIVLLDLSLGDENGQTLIPWLCDRQLMVLVYSMHEHADIIERCLDAGASGYVSKRELGETLDQAIRELLNGRRYISPRSTQSLKNRQQILLDEKGGTPFSEREGQILRLIGQGESRHDIALRFGVSVRTVETYCSRIMHKLDLDGMKALRRHAIQLIRKEADQT